MQKFFVKTNQIKDKQIEILGDSVNHIKNVLRLKINEKIEICDIYSSKNYICTIFEILKEKVICNIIEEHNSQAEPNTYINIIQGIPKGDKFEWIIEKCTEVGASEFTPLKMDRCITKIDDEKQKQKKLERWRKIAESAAMQSKRDIIPTINNFQEFNNIPNIVKDYDFVYVAYENEKENTLKHELKKINNISNKKIKIAVIIGPEGGISDEEIEKIKEWNIPIITLGNTILRTETAPIVISSIILYEI